ncbi:hypothetical protein BGZ73_007424 [Actinomortierella ambigua]|nr:hypothetical protein BGZ73_007424 [Actinomortierella ambigua]
MQQQQQQQYAWSPLFEDLERDIQHARYSSSRQTVYNAYHKLENAKSQLFAVLDFPKPSAACRTELNQGKPKINGQVMSVNEQFIAETIALSDHLDINEFVAASLLHYGIQEQEKYDRGAKEVAILLFHRERNALLSCLYDVIDTNSTKSSADFLQGIKPFRIEALSATGGNVAAKILKQIDSTSKEIKKLRGSLSATSALVQQFGMSALQHRLELLEQEHLQLATVLFAIAFYHELTLQELKDTLVALQQMNLSDPVALYLTATVMAALEISKEHSVLRDRDALPAYATERSISAEIAPLVTQGNWAVPAIQAVILVQFALCVCNAFEDKPFALVADEYEKLADKGISLNAFQFMASYLLGFKSYVPISDNQFEVPFELSNDSLGILEQNIDGFDTVIGKPSTTPMTSLMRDNMTMLFEHVIRDLILKFYPLLRKIKHREEDVQRHHTLPSAFGPAKTAGSTRNDLEAFFTVIALVYKGRPEAGIGFWPNNDDRLYGFLKWGSDCRATARAYFDMLAALATGPTCAQNAYEFLKSNGGRYGAHSNGASTSLCSWRKLFEAIELYTDSLSKDDAGRATMDTIRPDEQALLKSLLNLLKVVAQYSPGARAAMNESKNFRVLHILFRFLICPLTVDLKAAVLDAVAAFAGHSTLGNESVNVTWDFLDQARILPKIYITPSQDKMVAAADAVLPAIGGSGVAPPNLKGQESWDLGIGMDIEEIETSNETYPETIAFVNLLSSLIQVPPTTNELLSTLTTVAAKQVASVKQGSIIPYVRFTLDVIFVKALNRPYRTSDEKWKVVDACLTLVERCLKSFDIGSYILGDVVNSEGGADRSREQAQQQEALRATQHPAFEILTRLLSGGDELRELLRIIGTGVEAVNRQHGSCPQLTSSVAKSFRILNKTIELQDVFIEYIVQSLLTTANTKSTVLASLAPVEQHLAFYHNSVIDIACYINCNVSNEICSLSITILDRLAASPHFTNGSFQRGGGAVNRLVRLIESSPQSKQILYGYAQKVESEDDDVLGDLATTDDADDMQVDGQQPKASEGIAPILSPRAVTGSSIRLQILQLLLDNLSDERNPPTITHFLLGLETQKHTVRSKDQELGPSSSVLFAILDLLRRGTTSASEGEPWSEPLYFTQPQLAEKCQELIYRLCADSYTSATTMRFLRTSEAFFYRQLLALPTHFEEGMQGQQGTLRRVDGSYVHGDFEKLLSQLYQRAWVMRTAALEMRIAYDSNQRNEVVHLLSVLYSSTESVKTVGHGHHLGDSFSVLKASNGRLVQPKMKILELLDSLGFGWEDELTIREIERYYFADVKVDLCLEKDSHGVELFTIVKVFDLLLSKKSQLEQEGVIATPSQKAAAQAEIEAILQQCLARNHARSLEASKKAAYIAWREMVEMTMGHAFDLLKSETREAMIIEILTAVLAKIQQEPAVEINVILSRVALCLIQRLRSDHLYQFILQATTSDPTGLIDGRLPTEQLQTFARSLIACILKPGTPLSRCNLYSTFVDYLHYTREAREMILASQKTSSYQQPTYRVDGEMVPAGKVDAAWDAISAGNQYLVSEAGDRLYEVVCRDASDVDPVCKIAAFTLLNSLCALFRNEHRNPVVVHIVRRNYLKHFIDIIAREDSELQATVKGKYSKIRIVNEARLTLFLRIAQRREGAEQLLEYGFFDVLSNPSSVIDMRPELNRTDYGAFEQTESDIYHNIVYPMLQVANAILANLGRKHRTAASKAEHFLASHRDTFASILKDADSSSSLTLNTLREVRVVTAFMNQLAGHVDSRADWNDVFGELHSLLVALIPKYFAKDQWAHGLEPSNEGERLLSRSMISALGTGSAIGGGGALGGGYGSSKAARTMTAFERDATNLANDIRKNIVSYCQQRTDYHDRTATAMQPMFGWAVSSGLGAGSGFGSSITSATSVSPHSAPTMGHLISFLGRITEEVHDALPQQQTLRFKLNHISTLTPEEKQDIVEATDLEGVADNLAAAQRDQLAVQVLQHLLVSTTQDLMTKLYLLENTLVLFWRHLSYYLGQFKGLDEDTSSSSHGLGVSRFGMSKSSAFGASTGAASMTGAGGSASVFGASSSSGVGVKSQGYGAAELSKHFRPSFTDAQTLKRDAGHAVKPILERIAGLELTPEMVGQNYMARNSFISVLVRRIRDLLERTQA